MNRRRTPYAIRALGSETKSFGSVDTIHRVGGNRRPEAGYRVHVHVMGNEIIFTAGGLEILTPDRAVDLARRLLNAADYASHVNVGDP